jgi:hypothetical protein
MLDFLLFFNQMQVNKLQFGSNYKLDQISLELILSNLNQKRHYLFYSGRKGQNLKQLSSLDPEKRLYELVKLKPANSQTGFQPTLIISFMIVFLIFQLHQL